MPKFYKKSATRGRPTGGRRFVVPKTKTSPKKKTIKQKADSTIESLNVLLSEDQEAKKRINDRNLDKNAIFSEESEQEFDGLSDVGEAKDLYSQALSYERKKAKSVEDQIKQIAEEKDAEKRELEKQIRDLKREMHRTAPLHDTKFFSLSKELSEAIMELEKVASQPSLTIPRTVNQETRQTPLPVETFLQPQAVASTQPTVVTAPPAVAREIKTEEPKPVEEKKSLPKKKVLVTGVSAVLTLFVISGLAAKFLTSKPAVDEKLVAEYLTQAGEVQGAQSQTDGAGGQKPEVDASQDNVTFEQSVWEEYKDGNFGITLQYPKNAVKVVRTDSNITFIRKTGYLFKVQRIETSLTVEEYWKQIKATSLNYVVSNEKFKGKTALKLELEDLTDYPGDRYLVKEGNFIYDIWYATPSTNFEIDDIKRAEKMLASLSIIDIAK